MKNKTNKVRTFFFVVTTCLISSYSFGQIDFGDMTLNMLQSIAYTTKYDDIVALGESKRIELTITKSTDKTESLYFKAGDKDIYLLYSENKKLVLAHTKVNLYLEPKTIMDHLRENDFEQTDNLKTEADAFKPTIWYYNNDNYPYGFVIKPANYDNLSGVWIFNKEFGSFEKFFE